MRRAGRGAAAFALAGAAWAQTPAKRAATLDVHLLVECSSPEAGKVKAGAQCVDRTPFLTEKDIQTAEIQKNQRGRWTVFLTFRDEAARRELQVTKANLGKRVAIVVNGKLVSTVSISAASRLLFIDGNYTEADARAVADGFNRALRQ